MWCRYVVGRPPAKFHRIRSPFDAPTDNYSGSIAGLTSDVFGLRKPCRAASLPSSLRPTRSSQSVRPNLTSLVDPALPLLSWTGTTAPWRPELELVRPH